MDKKLKGAVVALIGSLCYGGAQLLLKLTTVATWAVGP